MVSTQYTDYGARAMDFHTLSSLELARGIRTGRFTSVAVTEHFIARIERLNPALNAVVVFRPDKALELARQADQAVARGDTGLGALHGVPMTIKETWEIEGWPTTAGHEKLRDHVSPRTAPAVQRLMDAGAIVVGKTNVPEFAGDLQSYNTIYGTTANPWNPALTPGGSSGGAAVALVTGMTSLELGSDIGGSIRTPAAFCGVYGLKPTYGLVPVRGHIPGPPGALARRDIGVAGPMARHLDDLELALDELAGPDTDMAAGWRIDLPAGDTRELSDLRVAFWLDDDYCPVQADVKAGLETILSLLQARGCQTDTRARPDSVNLPDSDQLYYHMLAGVMASELPPAMLDKFRRAAKTDADDYRSRFARGASQSHAQWLQHNEKRARLQANWADFFRHHDFMICPVANALPFPHDHSQPFTDRVLRVNGQNQPYMSITVWAGLAGIAGLPALTIPISPGENGLPRAIQVIAPAWHEKPLIQFGRLLAARIHPHGLPWPDEPDES
jgi:amidase